MARMTVSQARAQMREALDKVKAGEEIEITQNGEVVAVWVHPSQRRPMVRTRATVEAERLLEELRKRRGVDVDHAAPGLTPEYADELVRSIRADRDKEDEL